MQDLHELASVQHAALLGRNARRRIAEQVRRLELITSCASAPDRTACLAPACYIPQAAVL